MKIDLSRLNLYTLVRDLLQNIWVIILAAVIGLAGSITYYNNLYSHKYTSSMTIALNLKGYTQNATATSLGRTVDLAESLDDVFASGAIRDVVRHDIGEDMTASISAEQLGATNLIKISATDATPIKAYKTLRSVYENYPKVTDYVFTNVVISVVENPQMPKGPSNSVPTSVMSVLFALIAAVVVAAIIALTSFLRDTVKNISDVETELDAKLFGAVYSVKRSKKNLPSATNRLIITNTFAGFAFAESYRKMAVKIESLSRTKSIKSFMVTSVAEDEGKTTVSVNLAVALAQDGYKVLLMDCDLKKPAVYNFFDHTDRNPETDFHKYLEDGGPLENYIKFDKETGLYLAQSVSAYNNTAEILSSHSFSEALSFLSTQFDFIIIDTPPCGIAVDAEVISGVVDAYVMVTRQDYVRVSDINDHIENFSKPYFAGCIFNNICGFGQDPAEQDIPDNTLKEGVR